MTASNTSTDPTWVDPDDAPDLSTPNWQQRFATARRGRPPSRQAAKVATSLRLDADVIACLKRDGPGWQTRANALLRQALGL